MSTPTDQQRHEQLEQRLRAAADAVPQRPVPGEAWRDHQRRLAGAGRRRSGRVLAIAAALVLVLGLVGAAALLDDGPPGGGAAQGGADDPWAPENIRGEPVVAETLVLSGQQIRHQLVLTDTDGKGPSLCDRYVTVATGAAAGGCTARQPDADDPSVAIDWISGSSGSGDIHSVEAAVDSRVMKVQVWMSNGDEVLAVLHPTGWDDTRMFALTVPDTGPTPQRLVAYSDAKGTVLQAIDLGSLFGDDWLPTAHACDAGDADIISVSGIAVREAPREVQLASTPDPGARWSTCLLTDVVMTGVQLDGDIAFVVGPEVDRVRLPSGEQARPVAIPGSLLRLVVVPGSPEPNDVFLAEDVSGQALARLIGIELS